MFLFAHGAPASDPCTVTWDGGAGDSSWSSAANWSTDLVPTSVDKACITNGASVTHSSGSDAVGGLESNGPLTVSGGTLVVGSIFDSAITGSLTVSAEVFFQRSLTIAGISQSGGILGGTGTIETPSLSWSGGVQGWLGAYSGGTTRVTSGGSGLSISGSTTKEIGGRTLEVASGAVATQTGTGTLAFSTQILGPARINNSGTWTVSGDSDVLLTFGATAEFKNLAGATFEKTSGSGETTLGISFTNDGTVEAESGQINLGSNISGDNHDGTFTASTGATLRLSGTSTFASGSQITGTGTGKVQFPSGTSTINGTYSPPVTEVNGGTALLNGSTSSSATVTHSSGTLAGSATFEAKTYALSGGTIGATSAGTTKIVSGGTGLSISGSSTLSNRTLDIASGVSVSQTALFQLASDSKVNNSGTWTIPGDADVTVLTGLSNEFKNLSGATLEKTSGSAESTIAPALTNDGTLRVVSGTVNASSGLTNLSSGTLSGGSYKIQGTFKFAGADIVTNAAPIELDGLTAQITDALGLSGLRNLASNAAAGSLTLKNGAPVVTLGALANAGSVAIGPSSTLTTIGNYTQSAGTTTLNDSTATLTATAGAVQLNGGVLKGVGTVGPSLVNAAEVQPGNSAGILKVTGTYTQQSGGTLRTEVNGAGAAGTDYDQLKVTGAATLGGTLAVERNAGYDPGSSDSHRVVDGVRTGTFSTVTGTGLSGNRSYTVEYNAADVTLRVTTTAASISDVTVTEGSSPNTVQADFTITLSSPPAVPATVNWATADGTATQPADYTSASGTAVFAIGDQSETVSVTVKGDNLDEADETFLVNLSTPVNASISDSQGVGTITDDDPTPSLVIGDVVVVEGDSGQDAVNLPVNLSAASGRQVTVQYDTADGTAGQPSDYTQASGTLTFAPGDTSETVTVQVNGDLTDESDEDFFVDLSNAVSATIADGRGRVTLADGDGNPVAVNDSVTVQEDAAATAIDVLANDTDADGGPKVIASASDPVHGTVSLTGGSPGAHTGLTYQPDANYCNSPPGTSPDTFTYTLNGGSQATVSVTVTCADDAPVAVGDSATVLRDSGATAIDVLANDTDVDGGTKSIQSTSDPLHGTVVITGGGSGLTYQPDTLYCNDPPGLVPDTFTYTLNGGSTATVSVTVTCDLPPVAVADLATVTEDAAATPIDVLANDTDVDGGTKVIASATDPANGTVALTGGSSGAHTGLTYQPDANYCNSGVGGTPDTFNYTLNGGSSTSVAVTVSCIDDAPVAVNDSATKAEDSGATSIDVLANDTDIDGGPKSIQSTSDPDHGTVVITGGGSGLTYAPDANYCNDGAPPDDTFTYTLNGGSQATVSVAVTCVEDGPVGVDDSATVNRGSGATAIDVLANDTDADGGTKVITSASDPLFGTVVLTGGSPGAHTGLTYQPDGIYCNDPPGLVPDTFTYTLNGGSQATVSVTVTCIDLPPVPVADTATVTEDAAATAVDVLGNDQNLDGGPLTISAASDPANGTVVLTGGSSGAHTGLTYQPDANYCNSGVGGVPDTFTYTVNGGLTAIVSMTVNCVDDGPVAVDDSATEGEDSSASAIDVLANDTDIDGGPKTISSASDPANGTVQVAGDNLSLTYQPDANYCNDGAPPDDTFTYTLNGGSQATVSVAVTCVDDNPVAVNDSATVGEDSGATSIDVLANDTDIDGGTKSIQSKTNGAHGTVAITGGGSGLTYAPDANYCGSDSFTYTLNGGSQATVSVAVTCVDDSPVAVNDSATKNEDSGATAIDVLANDTDIDGGTKSIQSKTNGAHGTVVITGGGTGLTYAPDANYCNDGAPPDDTFTYTLNGGSQATVSVAVTCVDDSPVAVNDSATKAEDSGASAIDVLANDTDVDGGTKSIQSKTNGAHGTVVITGGGSGLTYQPEANYCNDGAPPDDTFTYTLNGGSQATVSVAVSCVDDGPTGVTDFAEVGEDSGPTAIGVLANDTDTDGGPKTIQSKTNGAHGTVAITGGGSGLTYTPNANYCNNPPAASPDNFTYTLNGGSVANVYVFVDCVDDNPVAVNDSATKAEDSGATSINVLANDTDMDGGTKSIQSASDPANGTVAITGGGTGVTYAPDANYCNDGAPPDDAFTYTLNGGSQATVSVAVTCVDDNPVAVADAGTVLEDAVATPLSVLANDTDVDGGTKAISSASDPAHGTVVLAGGTPGAHTGLTYQPDPNYCNDPPATSLDTFTYTLNGGSTTSVSMRITCQDEPTTPEQPPAQTPTPGTQQIPGASDTGGGQGTKGKCAKGKKKPKRAASARRTKSCKVKPKK